MIEIGMWSQWALLRFMQQPNEWLDCSFYLRFTSESELIVRRLKKQMEDK